MSDKLVHFKIPASFIGEIAKITPRELRYGYQRDWISDEDTVHLAMSCIVHEREHEDVIESLSLLLKDELDRVPELVAELVEDEKSVWIFLALAWVHGHPQDFDNNAQHVIDLLYADFEYPSEMDPFVSFMPPPEGGVPGVAGILERLNRYLIDSRDRYLRGRQPGAGS